MSAPYLAFMMVKDETGGAIASGPTSTDTHVNRIIGAIHPFTPGPDGMCVSCGKAMHKAAATTQNTLVAEEEHSNNNYATPPSPMLVRFMTPEDDATHPFLSPDDEQRMDNTNALARQKARATLLAPRFHEPIAKARTPRGMESGQLGEWQSPSNPGVYDPSSAPGGPTLPRYTRPISQDPPRDPMGNVRQDGPITGPANPGMDPITQVTEAARMASPDIQRSHDDDVHNFTQCPQCGVAVTGSEKLCPNAWCGHNLTLGDHSFDSWER